MKALSLWQPWASLVAIGAKRIETRSWRTNYRGAVAIHASKRYGRNLRGLVNAEPFHSALSPHFGETDDRSGSNSWLVLPLGAILAVSKILDCIPTDKIKHLRKTTAEGFDGTWSVTPQEWDFGDYSSGRWAWILGEPKMLAEPIPAKGSLGLWEWEPPEGLLKSIGIT